MSKTMNLKFVFYIYIFYISLSLALRSWLICVHFIIVKPMNLLYINKLLNMLILPYFT